VDGGFGQMEKMGKMGAGFFLKFVYDFFFGGGDCHPTPPSGYGPAIDTRHEMY